MFNSFMKLVPLATLAVCLSCSSVPDFKPSKPLEEASSLNDAMDVCASYQIQGETSSSGTPLSARAAVLTPWLSCFEKLFQRFPAANEREDLIALYRGIKARHTGAPTPTSTVIDWAAMNLAVRRSVEHLKNDRLSYSADERKLLEQELPDYAMYLAEHNAFSPAVAKTERQQKRKKMHVGPPEEERLPPPPRPLASGERDYCERYNEYIQLAINLQELNDYRKILEERTYRNPTNSNEIAMRDRITERVKTLEQDVATRKQQLESEFAGIRAQSGWFRNGYCK